MKHETLSAQASMFATRERISTIGKSLTKIFNSIENSIDMVAEDLAPNVEQRRLEQLFALLDKEKSELMRLLNVRATFQSRLTDSDREKVAPSASRPLGEVHPEASSCEQ